MAASRQDEIPSSPGFRAVLKGISIGDLIQMNCLSGAFCGVRVTSKRGIGSLQFGGGRLCHASTATLTGDSAALEILAWEAGNVEPEAMAEAPQQTVSSTWQHLLMVAAQARDESVSSNVVPVTQRTAAAVSPGAPRSDRQSGALPSSEPLRIQESNRPTSRALPKLVSADRVRLDPSGNPTFARGQSETLGALAAFATQLSRKIGTELGLGAVHAIETRHGSNRTVIAVATTGAIEAATSSVDTELLTIRRSAGL